jgi:hypothetical protein
MDFEGPSAVDYENVFSLNAAYLALLRRDPAARCSLSGMPESLIRRLVTLSDHQSTRLSRTPFLLLSFRERDDRFWESIFDDPRGRDLFSVPSSAADELGRLIAAGLGFVWQLAKHNPYATRLICGASLHWCEQLAERTFLHILALAGMHPNVLVLRSVAVVELWTKLLEGGVSRENDIRHAAHISALQCVLTSAAMPTRRRWAAAACAVRTPTLRVADDTDA